MAKKSQSSTVRSELPPRELPPLVVGMTVRLASGGPLMTVEEVGDSQVVCVWFQEIGGALFGRDLLRESFNCDCLEIIQ